MPYNKKSALMNRLFRGGKTWRKDYRRRGLASQLKRVKKDLRRVKKDIEYKHKDKLQASTSVSTSPYTYAIGLEEIHELQDDNVGSAGTSGADRDGNKITLSRISIRGQIVNGDDTNMVRVLLVKYHRTPLTWSGPAMSHVLTNTSIPHVFHSHYKKESIYNTTVLYDKVFKVQRNMSNSSTTNNYSAVYPEQRFFTIKKKFKKGLVIEYPDVNYVQSSGLPYDNTPNNNNIVLMCVSDSSEGTVTGHPQIMWECRMNYTG